MTRRCETDVLSKCHEEYILVDEEKLTLTVTFFCALMNSRGTATMFDDFQIVFSRVLLPFILMTDGPQIFHMI